MIDTISEDDRRNRDPQKELQRSTPRLTLAELNERDFEDIRRRFNASRRDARPPVVKALDLIDAPRNVVANVLFPGTARRIRQSGDRGTGGLPRVRFSDALDSLGVENQVARGIVGFVGDVALDPLTYLGGTGAAVRLTGKTVGGAGVTLSRTGRRVVNRSAQEAVQGGLQAVRNESGRNLLRGLGFTDEKLTRLSAIAAARGDDPVKAVQRTVLGQGSRPRASAVLRTGGFDTLTRGGRLDRFARLPVSAETPVATQARVRAATDFAKRFQRGSTDLPGVNLTRGAQAGSEIAHIPFTDAALRVPAFTREGAERLANIARATAAANPAAVQRAAGTTQALQIGRNIDNVVADLQGAQQRIAQAQSEMAAGSPTSAVLRPGEEILDQTDLRSPADVIALERAEIRGLEDEIAANRVRTRAISNNIETVAPTADQAPGVVQAQAAELRLMRAAEERAAAIARQQKALIDAPLTTGAGDFSVREIRSKIRTEYKQMVQQVRDKADELGEAVDANDVARIDAEIAEIRQRFTANQLDEHIDLILASDEEFRAFEGIVDALQVGADAATEAAIASGRSVVDLASMTDLERGAAMLARSAIGSDSVTQGAMLITPVGRVMAALGVGQDAKVARSVAAAGRMRRGAFQNRDTALHEVERLGRALSGPGARDLEEAVKAELAQEVIKVLNDFSIDRKHFDSVDQVVTALQMRLLSQGDQAGRAFNVSAWPDDPAKAVFNDAGQWVDESGEVVESSWLESIRNLQADAVLSEKVNPGLMSRLEEIAQSRLQSYANLADEAKRAGLLEHVRAMYVPNIPTDDLANVIAIRGRHGPSRARSGAQAAEDVVEGFQKARTSDQIRFKTEAAGWRRFFEWERMFLDDAKYGDKAIEGMDPETADFIRGVREAINDYDNLPVEEQFKYPPRPTSPFELNELASSGRLAHITNSADLPRSAFETSSTLIAARRAASHQRALAKKRIQEYQAKLGVMVDKSVWKQNSQGTEVTLSNGATARVIPSSGSADRPSVVEIGGARYRPLSSASVRNGDSNVLYGDSRRIALYPEQTAEFIERTQAVLADPTTMDQTLRVMERINGLWKTTTLSHPSWWVGNVTGNTILGGIALAQHGVAPTALLKNAKPLMAMMLARGKPEQLRKITLNINGQRVRADELMDFLSETGVVGPNKSNEVAVSAGLGDGSVRAAQRGLRRGFKDTAREADHIVAESDILQKLPDAGQKVARASVFGSKQFMAAIGAWFRFNRATDDMMRAMTYVALADNGVPQADAVTSTIRNLFDYGDLSRFENKVLRNTIPFFVWAKESLVHQVNLVARNPIYAGLAPKSVASIEEMLAGDQALPDHMRPAWMRENMALQLTTDPDSRVAFTAGTLLPQEQLFRALATLTGPDGAQDFLNFMVSSTTPVVKTPVEIGFGVESFTGRTIGATSQDADLSVLEHVTGQVRPLREIGSPFSPRRGAIFAAAERGLGEGVGRALIGGRIQSLSDERSRFNLIREVQTESENIRRAIRLAEREGDAGLSQRGRISLLQLYRDALESGLEEAVPKWAQAQIRELGAGTSGP